MYVHHLPPCSHACPALEDIQGWLYEAEAGGDGYEHAWRHLVAANPFPAIMGASATTRASGVQPGAARRSGRDQLGRALPRR